MAATTETKFALVTGASSGIGFEVAKRLASKKIKVFACARRLSSMEPLELHGVTILQCDVTDPASVAKLKEIIAEKTGNKLDLLFNNAGVSCSFPTTDVPDEAAAQCFETNVLGPIRLVREFSEMLINAKGTIAFTGSIAGVAPFPFGSVYSASKAAIHQYAHVLHLEMRMFDVKVVNLVTGGVSTNIADTRPLPENSVFNTKEGLEAFTYRQRIAKNTKPQSAEVYAKNAVEDILNASTRTLNVYRGTHATYVPLLIRWLPNWVIEYGFMIKFKLLPVWKAFHKTKSE